MKKVLVTNAGRSAGLNFCRSLRIAPEKYEIIGIEQDKYSLFNAECDKKYLCPNANSPEYIPYIKKLVSDEKIDVVYPSKTNEELWLISKHRDEIGAKTFLPKDEIIQVYEDKFKTFDLMKAEGIKVADTRLICSVEDLNIMFEKYPKGVWLRAIKGCGGKGSIVAESVEFAKSWIDHCNGWGVFTASEILSDKTASWSGIWKDGELIVSQIRKRLYWEFGYLAPSGVTGITGAQITARDSELDELAIRSILAVNKKPHGIVSVDFTYDFNGIPNPTEIQASRFFTSTYFMAEAGLNFPYLWMKMALGEEIPQMEEKFSPLEPDLLWIKYVDCKARLSSLKEIEKYKMFA